MFGSFLPSLWSSSNQSVLRSRERTLLCNHVPDQFLDTISLLQLTRLTDTELATWDAEPSWGLVSDNMVSMASKMEAIITRFDRTTRLNSELK